MASYCFVEFVSEVMTPFKILKKNTVAIKSTQSFFQTTGTKKPEISLSVKEQNLY